MRYKCCHSGNDGMPVCEERRSDTASDLADCQWVDDPWCVDAGGDYRPYEIQYLNKDPMPEGCSCSLNGQTVPIARETDGGPTVGPFHHVVHSGDACVLKFMCV